MRSPKPEAGGRNKNFPDAGGPRTGDRSSRLDFIPASNI